MKKILLILVSILMLQQVKAQDVDNSFYKHALIISYGFGGEGYAVTETYNVNGVPGVTYTNKFSAVSASYPLSAEYGIGNRLGIGLVGKVDNYYIKKDSITGFQQTIYGFEFGALINYHFVRKKHIDFFAGLNLGFSSFTWTLNSSNDQLYGSGGWGDIHATLRYYFGRFGLFGSLSFPTMNYNNFSSNNGSINTIIQYLPASWKASGVAFNLGIQYRIFNPPADK
jgi:hypothetical protein